MSSSIWDMILDVSPSDVGTLMRIETSDPNDPVRNVQAAARRAAGAARARGGLSAADFVRQITVQRVTQAGLRRIGNTVMTLAHAEGLQAHAASIEIRMK